MERAIQTGDANAWVALWTREGAAEQESKRKYIRPQPEAHYRLLNVFVRGDQGTLFAQLAADSFVSMTLRREDGTWKLDKQTFSNVAPDAKSAYAILPPAEGPFSRAGSPWDRVAAALPANDAARRGWQVRGIYDDSFLYLRLESISRLPVPGSSAGVPGSNAGRFAGGWPNMRIDVAGAGEFLLFPVISIGDHATFGKDGRANSHRPFSSYMIRLEHNDQAIFSASSDDLIPSSLIAVSDHSFDLRIPLATMGITDSRSLNIVIGDASWPQSAIMSFAVAKFER
jgi:hypothetical protein